MTNLIQNTMSPQLRKTLLFFILALLAIVWVFPYFILILTSLKEQGDLMSNGVLAMPQKVLFKNYVTAFIAGDMWMYVRNSILITITKVPAGIFVAGLAAFAIAKHRFKGSRWLFFFMVLGLGIPFQVTLLPLNILLKNLGLLDSLAALFFPYIAFGLPVSILVLRGFFRSIPDDFLDNARIDGAREFTIFWRIILPLARPAVAALFILDFLWTWNEFIMALIFIQSPKWQTVPLGLMYFQGQYSSSWTVLCAGVTIGILPIIIVYLLFQRHFASGLFGPGLK